MGKPRLRGSHAIISVGDTEVGEITKFSVKELGEIKKSRAIGDPGVTANKTFEGYDLSFEGGKVDWKLAALLHVQDEKIYGKVGSGSRAPLFKVTQKIHYYGASQPETYTYNDVVIYGYNLDIDANDEMMEKFEGFCGTLRVPTVPAVDPKATVIKSAVEKLIDEQIAAAFTPPTVL
jgi:hypothetical protein